MANALADWVKAQVISRFNSLLEPIISGLESYIETLGMTIQLAIEGYASPEDVRDAMLGPLSGLSSVLDVIQKVTNIVSPVMDAIGSAVSMIIDTAVDTMASLFGGNSDDVDGGFIDLITGSEDADPGELIIDYFGFDDSGTYSNGVSLTSEDPDAVAAVLAVLNLIPAIGFDFFYAGTGQYAAAAGGLTLASIGLLSSVFYSLNPLILTTFGLLSATGGFIQILKGILNNGITNNPYADAVLLGWTGLCAGYSSYNAYVFYSENNVI